MIKERDLIYLAVTEEVRNSFGS